MRDVTVTQRCLTIVDKVGNRNKRSAAEAERLTSLTAERKKENYADYGL